jgi:hypothetical protein
MYILNSFFVLYIFSQKNMLTNDFDFSVVVSFKEKKFMEFQASIDIYVLKIIIK